MEVEVPRQISTEPSTKDYMGFYAIPVVSGETLVVKPDKSGTSQILLTVDEELEDRDTSTAEEPRQIIPATANTQENEATVNLLFANLQKTVREHSLRPEDVNAYWYGSTLHHRLPAEFHQYLPQHQQDLKVEIMKLYQN